MDTQAKVEQIIDAVQAFAAKMIDYSHEGGGMGGFEALGMLADIREDIKELAALSRDEAREAPDLVALVQRWQHWLGVYGGTNDPDEMAEAQEQIWQAEAEMTAWTPAAPSAAPEVETLRAELAAARAALAEMVKQKHEPSEYYGSYDDLRCAFCGEDYVGHDRDEGERHTPGCAWMAARAVLAGSAPTGKKGDGDSADERPLCEHCQRPIDDGEGVHTLDVTLHRACAEAIWPAGSAPTPEADRCLACGGPHLACECCTTPGFLETPEAGRE